MEQKSKHLKRSLPQKQFVLRESLLTEIMKDSKTKAMYNMAIASFIGYIIHQLVVDYNSHGEFFKVWYLTVHYFRNFHLAVVLWAGIYCLACVWYFIFNFWVKVRTGMSSKSKMVRVLDITAVSALVAYYIFSYRLVRNASLWFDLVPLLTMICVYEQTRLLMKVHSFIRFNAEKVVNFEVREDKVLKLPTFLHFVYFTFAPTLIYRDVYPRTKSIRWSFAFRCLLETLASTIYIILLWSRSISPFFEEFGSRKFTKSELTIAVFKSTIPGLMTLLATFYLLLHTSQNFFAEILRFGDRLFYKDWWNSSSFSEYFRTWNLVVHDWLFEYIFKDLVEIVLPNRICLGKFMVFFISAVVHEIAMIIFLNSFFPVMFVEFFFVGAVLSVVNLYVGNILFLYLWSFGSGTLFCAYTIEYWAKQNSPPVINSTYDFLIPRSIACDCIT